MITVIRSQIKVETTDGIRWILAEEAGIPLDA